MTWGQGYVSSITLQDTHTYWFEITSMNGNIVLALTCVAVISSGVNHLQVQCNPDYESRRYVQMRLKFKRICSVKQALLST